MSVPNSPRSWIAEAEAVVRSLRDVDSVKIVADGDAIRELHIESSSERPAKHIVRDVQTLFQTRLHRGLDHKVVSVAFVARANGTHGPPPMRNGTAHAPVSAPDVHATPGRESADDGRIRFGSVNLLVMGTRAQAQVELRWKGVSRMGNASGWSTRDGAHWLVAQATLTAVQQYLEDDVALKVDDVQSVHLGRKDVVVSALTLLAHRQEKNLVGCCTVEQDAQQAVVLATLSALNRVVGGLKTKQPIEYVLRPTPFRGA